MHIQKPLRITKGNNSNSIGPLPLFFIHSICLVHMNVFAKFNEIQSMILQDIKETKRNRYTHMVGRTDNVKAVYPPTKQFAGGYRNRKFETKEK